MPELEKEAESVSHLPASNMSTAWIIDGMAVLQMIRQGGTTCFGQLAELLFRIVCRPLQTYESCNRVDVVFDQYDFRDSIKAFERARRQSVHGNEIKIHGPSTPIPMQWSKFIGNPRNKEHLVEFFSESWCQMSETFLGPNQEMFIAGGFRDGLVTRKVTSDGAVDQEDLFSSHEEADTWLLLHVAHASQECPRVVVWSPDTDVAVLCIHFYHKLEATQELWFHTGVKDKARFIPVHSIAGTLGVQLCKMLPAVHTLTGCDSTSSLVRVGKLKPWKLVRKDPQKFRNLTNFGTMMEIPQT